MENITPDEEAQLVTMLGGKRGDRLVADAEGNYSIQPGMQMSDTPTDPVQARALASTQQQQTLSQLNDPNATLRGQARSSMLGEQQYQPLESFGVGAASSVVPTAASVVGGLLPSIATRAVTANPWAMAGAGLAGIPAAIAASHYANQLQQSYLDPSLQSKIDLASQQNPRAFKLGEVAPSLGAFGVSTAPLQSAARVGRDIVSAAAARGPLAPGMGAMLGNVGRQAMASGDVANIAGGALGAAIPAGMAYREYNANGSVDPFSAGVDIAAGLFINKPQKWLASSVNKISRGPILSSEGFIPRAGDELRSGLDMPALEMPVSEPDIPLAASRVIDSPDADALAGQIAKGREAVLAEQQAADKQAEKFRRDFDKAKAAREEQAIAEAVRKAREEERLAIAMGKTREQLVGDKSKEQLKMDRQQAEFNSKLAEQEQVPIEEAVTQAQQEAKMQREQDALATRIATGKSKEQKLKLKEQVKMGQQKLDFEKQYNEALAEQGKEPQYSTGDNALPAERISQELSPTEQSQLQNKLGTMLSKQGSRVEALEGNRYTTEDDPTLRAGKFNRTDESVEFATGNPDAAPHEAIHLAVSKLSPEAQTRFMQRVNENADFQRAKSKRPDLTPEEFIAEEGSVALAKQIKDKDFGLFRDLANIWRNMSGSKDIYDSMRSLGNVLAMGASKEGGSFNLNARPAPPRDVGPAGTYRRYPEMEVSEVSPKSQVVEGGESKLPTEISDTNEPLPDVQYSKLFDKTLKSTVDNIKEPHYKLAVRAAFNDAPRLAAELGVDINKIAGKLSKAGVDVKQLADAYRSGKLLSTPEAKEYYNEITRIANEANKGGVARMIKLKPGYVPEIFSREVTEILRKSSDSPEAKAVINELAKHWYDRPAAEALASHVYKQRTTNLDADFGPARKQAGLGLPDSVTVGGKKIQIRENDPVRALSSYTQRLAKDLAWYRNVESKYGRDIASEGMHDARTAYRGRYMDDSSQVLQQGMRAAGSMVTGTLTGMRNLMANPVQQAMYGGKDFPIKLAKSWIETASSYPSLRKEAIKSGVLRAGANQAEFNPNVDNPVAHGIKTFIDAKRLIDGSTALEDISRVQNMAFGKLAATDYINRARKGDKHALRAMERFGVDASDPEALKKLSSVIATTIESTYDARELPTFMHDSTLGDIMSIHKWGYEKMLTFNKDAIQPALKGDLAPLFYAIAAAAGITIPAIEGLNELARGRKGQPSLDEINAAEDVTDEKKLAARLAWFTDKLTTAGLGGYGANLANAGAAVANGRNDVQPIFVPLEEEAGNVKKLFADTLAAMNAGEPSMEVLKGFTTEALKIIFQAADPIIRKLPENEAATQHSSDLRDTAVYDKLVEGNTQPIIESNKLIGRREREFKQSSGKEDITPEKQAEMLGTLIESYAKQYGNDPIKLQEKIKALKTGGDRAFPTAIFGDPDDLQAQKAARFIDYLYKAYGAKEADAKIFRAARRYANEESRKELVPDL